MVTQLHIVFVRHKYIYFCSENGSSSPKETKDMWKDDEVPVLDSTYFP